MKYLACFSLAAMAAFSSPAVYGEDAAAPAPEPLAAPAPAPEADQLAILKSDAAWEAKAEACRALRQNGSAAAADTLAALLDDEKLSHFARFALEAIPAPEAAAALRNALATVSEVHKAGIAASLGARRDPEAVSALTVLLTGADDTTAIAAAAALGRIGTRESSRALRKYSTTVPDARRTAVGEGLLAACQHLANDPETAYLASETLKVLLGDAWPEHIRMGAFEWRARALPKSAHSSLLAALKGDDPKRRDFAAALVASIVDSPTAKYLSAVKHMQPGGQAALLRALGLRGDVTAEPALLEAMKSEVPEVRTAAILALGDLDTPGAVPALADLLTPTGTPESAAAREALRVSKAHGVDKKLAQAAVKAAPDQCAQLTELLTARMSPEAVRLGVKCLEGACEPVVRVASWDAFAQLGGADEFRVALSALPNAADGEEKAAATKALAAIAKYNKDAVLPLLLEALPAASATTAPVLLQTLGRIGTPPALAAVVAMLENPDVSLQDEAVKVLEDWPAADAAPHLLNVAKADDAGRRHRGLNGYARLAKLEGDPAKKGELLDAALPLCRGKEDKWVLLAAYGTVLHPHAFDALQAQLSDAEVRNEAGAAIVTVATELVKQDANAKPRAIEAIDAVIASCDRRGLLDRANAAKAELSK